LGPGQILRMRTHGIFIGHFGPDLEWPAPVVPPRPPSVGGTPGPEGAPCLPPATTAI
jgi:hypothetical protein